MSFQPGQMLGHYRLAEKIGEGGMGVVWSARDTVLERTVAVKILPEAFRTHADRLARFQREARLLAALSHPHIAAIHGLEEAEGVCFLVLEMVEGRGLEQLLAGGPLPVGEALELSGQISQALEAAHDKGIIHRDLKPANIKVTPEGRVKVLDFGLAKAFEPEVSDADMTQSPTMTAAGTMQGVVLGTAAYMSPEQARGRAVDKRTDIWSFGAVLYEMLTGKQVFGGETVSDILVSILQREPDWEALPSRTPVKVKDLLRRTLEKDAHRRLRDIGDARLDLEEAITRRAWSGPVPSAAPAPPTARRRRRLRRAGFLVLVIFAGLLGAAINDSIRRGQPRPVRRVSLVIPPHLKMRGAQLSPIGERLVISAREVVDGRLQDSHALFVRPLGDQEFTRLAGTEGVGSWAFSPDGRWLVFIQNLWDADTQRVMKVRLEGGPPARLWEGKVEHLGQVDWCDDGTLVLSTRHEGDFRAVGRLPATGGSLEILAAYTDVPGEIERLYSLPDCLGVLVTREVVGERGYSRNIDLLDTETRSIRPLIEDGYGGRYLSTGHVIFSRGETLLGVPFDLGSLATTGEILPVTSGLGIAASWYSAAFSLTADGSLIYQAGGVASQGRTVAVVDREGKVEPLIPLQRGFVGQPRISPDGQQVAVVEADATGLYHTVIVDLARGTLRTLALPDTDVTDPLWLPDGRHVATLLYKSGEDDRIARWPAFRTGQPEILYREESKDWWINLGSCHPDGVLLALGRYRKDFHEGSALLLEMESGRTTPLDLGSHDVWQVRFSPDGRLMAYVNGASGRPQVAVQSYPPDGHEWIVSSEGGRNPFWSGSGGALFFEDLRERLLVAQVERTPAFKASEPRVLAAVESLGATRIHGGSDYFHLAPDGESAVFVARGEREMDRSRLVLVLNWAEELKERVPAP